MREITLTRNIEATPDRVYEFFTSSEKWTLWQGKKTTIEPRVGGRYEMVAPNNGVARGEVVELIPDRRIVFTWGWEGHPDVPPGSSTVTIDLVPSGGTTTVVLTHTGLPEGEIGLHQQGWDHYLTRLKNVTLGEHVDADGGLG